MAMKLERALAIADKCRDGDGWSATMQRYYTDEEITEAMRVKSEFVKSLFPNAVTIGHERT